MRFASGLREPLAAGSMACHLVSPVRLLPSFTSSERPTSRFPAAIGRGPARLRPVRGHCPRGTVDILPNVAGGVGYPTTPLQNAWFFLALPSADWVRPKRPDEPRPPRLTVGGGRLWVG